MRKARHVAPNGVRSFRVGASRIKEARPSRRESQPQFSGIQRVRHRGISLVRHTGTGIQVSSTANNHFKNPFSGTTKINPRGG